MKLDFSAPAKFSNLGPGLNALLGSRGLLDAQTDIDIKAPQQLMGSFVHAIDDKWTVLGNVGWQNWKKFGEVEVSIDSSNPVSVTTDIPFKNTWHAAIGAQYQMSAPWRLNFGVAHDSSFAAARQHGFPDPARRRSAWRFGVGAQNVDPQGLQLGRGGRVPARRRPQGRQAKHPARRPRRQGQPGGRVQQHQHLLPVRQLQLEVLTSLRSALFVPLADERFLAKAHERGADALLLDLEDSVPPAQKAAARARLPEAARRLAALGATVMVRVNSSPELAGRRSARRRRSRRSPPCSCPRWRTPSR